MFDVQTATLDELCKMEAEILTRKGEIKRENAKKIIEGLL
jgi:hypothetical protein